MFEREADLCGAVIADSFRRSVIVLAPESCFIERAVDERRSCGLIREVIVPEETLPPVDRLVTGVMLVWAVSIFVGMSYLAAII
ncbi:MAG: hypothetical protein JO043_03150 [Candidatus Eremiobacteraeota bacterium]|nr:hypothetical protein [Candidatus Eremiobacteraeota bacterium]